MEGRVICAYSYWLLERQKEREWFEAEGKGGRKREDGRWMVDTKLC